MAQPSYTVKLINEVNAIMISQLVGPNLFGFGNVAATTKRGQEFISTATTKIVKISLQLSKTGNPTDNIIVKLYASNKTTLLATSFIILNGAFITTTPTLYDLFFDLSDITNSATYFIEVSRSGGLNASNFYRLSAASGTEPYTDGNAWVYNGSTWIENNNSDLIFKIAIRTIDETDISTDVKNISNINTGLNGVYGTIKQGDGLLTLQNDDSKYSPLNSSSSLYGKFRVKNKIKIIGTYSAVNYSLFTGIIQDIEPLMAFEKRVVDVRLLDILSEFTGLRVSIGTQTNKTASELITLLVEAGGISPSQYDIQEDPEDLQSVTWNDVNLIEKLNEIVTAGQHYHYIDGDGKYIFKTNQFLSSDIPLFTYETDDPDDAKQRFAITDIFNKVSVEYTGSNFAESEDENSIFTFGSRERILENDLLDRADYAQFISDYIVDLQKDAGNIIEFDLSFKYPDVYKIEFGDPVRMIEPFHHIDNIYNILEKNLQILNTQQVKMKAKGRKFVFPPQVDTVILEPVVDDTDITINVNSDLVLQGFKVANDSKLISLGYKLSMTINTSFNVNLSLYELNGSGFPSVFLASSNLIVFSPPSLSGFVEWNFSQASRPTLVTTKTYGAFIALAGDLGKFSNFTMRGKNIGIYANGKPAERISSVWTTMDPKDLYFKAILQEV